MNTKLLMTTSALVMGLAGVAFTFAPQEILAFFEVQDSPIVVLMLQLLGALYVAFAMTNWMARVNLIGGIYNRPLAVGNVTHFMIGALALLKGYSSATQTAVLVVALVYVLFAVLFIKVLFTHPVKEKKID